MAKKIYIKEASLILGRHHETLRRWDMAGILCPYREPGSNYRYYTESQISRFKKTHKYKELQKKYGKSSNRNSR